MKVRKTKIEMLDMKFLERYKEIKSFNGDSSN